jgi:lipopolysaccharide transport system ATP-binding protein
MGAIQQLCSRCIVLKNGKVFFEGNVEESISFYLRSQKDTNKLIFPIQMKSSQILSFEMFDHFGNSSNSFIAGKNCRIKLKIRNDFENKINFNIRYQIFDDKENLISTINAYHQNATKLVKPYESYIFDCKIPKIALTDNNYVLGVRVVDFTHKEILFQKDNFFEFTIENGDYFDTGKLPSKENSGKFLIESEWQ